MFAIRIIILYLVIILFQTSVFYFLQPLTVVPDLGLIVVVYFGLFFKIESALSASFLMGFLQDIFSSTLIGMNAFTKTCTVFIVAHLSRRFLISNTFVQLFIVFLASIIQGIFLIVLNIFFSRKHSPATIDILFQSLLNFAIAWLCFIFLDKLLKGHARPDE